MTEMRERGDCFGVFNSPTKEERCGERDREKRARKKRYSRAKQDFQGFFCLKSQLRERNASPLLSQRWSCWNRRGEERLFERTGRHTKFCILQQDFQASPKTQPLPFWKEK